MAGGFPLVFMELADNVSWFFVPLVFMGLADNEGFSRTLHLTYIPIHQCSYVIYKLWSIHEESVG